jgi:seryl-tRNA synthetase
MAILTEERTLTLRDELLAAGLLYPAGVSGLYLRSAAYQSISEAISGMVSLWAATREPVSLHAPPVLARTTFSSTNYLESFPDLMGSVHTFTGDDAAHRELLKRADADGDWPKLLQPAEVVLAPAACHAVYPLCRAGLPVAGRWFEVQGSCFRHEPSDDVTRMQSFTMHELVRVGTSAAALEHRDRGLAEGLDLLRGLGLDPQPVPASDPFFGRVGTLLAGEQLAEELKIEGVMAIGGAQRSTALMSANYHKDHFGSAFRIVLEGTEVAHSSCVAFGIDRVTVAMLDRHGFDSSKWPLSIRARLWP